MTVRGEDSEDSENSMDRVFISDGCSESEGGTPPQPIIIYLQDTRIGQQWLRIGAKTTFYINPQEKGIYYI